MAPRPWRRHRVQLPGRRLAQRHVCRAPRVEDVDLALERAQDAANDPAWRKLLPHERATFLYRIADGIARHADRISQVQTRDTGKTLTETRALAMSACRHLPLYGGDAARPWKTR